MSPDGAAGESILGSSCPEVARCDDSEARYMNHRRDQQHENGRVHRQPAYAPHDLRAARRIAAVARYENEDPANGKQDHAYKRQD